jgi:hypothetical protein
MDGDGVRTLMTGGQVMIGGLSGSVARTPLRRPALAIALSLTLVLALGASLAVVMPRAARAASVSLTTCTYGALSAALANLANTDILFGIDCTIDFSSGGGGGGTITIGHTLTLDGNGHKVTLSGGSSVRVFNVSGGVAFTLDNLTIAHGKDLGTASTLASGGGLYNNGGTVTITQSTFSGNEAVGGGAGAAGGGLYSNGGTVTISGSTFAQNGADAADPFGGAAGGGLYNNGGTVTISGGTFAQNGVQNSGCCGSFGDNVGGGGLYNSGGTVTVSGGTFANNDAQGGYGTEFGGSGDGGGLDSPSGTVTITGSTFTGNGAFGGTGGPDPGEIGGSGSCGGLDAGGQLTISGSTFAKNSASAADGWMPGGGAGGGLCASGTATITASTFNANTVIGPGSGGGLYTSAGSLTLINSTVTANSVSIGTSNSGGGLSNGGGATLINTTVAANAVSGTGANGSNLTNSGTLTSNNSIVANGTGASNCAGTITDGGYNLESGTSCGFHAVHHSLTGTNPHLDALGNYGGPTQTMALLPGSKAINASGTSANGCPTTDQRGVHRPQGPACDIGAYEFVPTTTAKLSANPTIANQGQNVALTCAVTPATGTPGTPTGTVTFTDTTAGATLGSLTLSGGKATLNTTRLALGDHAITCAYNGDPSFYRSTSNSVTVTIGTGGEDVMGSGSNTSPPANQGSGQPGTSGGQASGSGSTNPPAAPATPPRAVRPATSSVPPLWPLLGGALVLLLALLGGGAFVLRRARRGARA